MGLSFPIWIAEGAMYYLISIGFDIHQPFHGLLLTTAVSNLSTSIPSTAGGVGPFEYSTQKTLEALGSPNAAAAYAIALHIALLVPVTVLGFIFLSANHIPLSRLLRRDDAAGSLEPGPVNL